MPHRKLKGKCIICGVELFNRKPHSKFCKKCADDKFKKERIEASRVYRLKKKRGDI